MPTAVPALFALDARVQATFLPLGVLGGSLFLWRPDGPPPGTDEARLMLGGRPSVIRGRSLKIPEVLRVFEAPSPSVSAAVAGYADIVRLARELIRRGGVRPLVQETRGTTRAGWRAAPDADERAVLAAIVSRMPPAGLASAPEQPFPPWAIARVFLNVTVDALIRAAAVPPQTRESTWESELEQALVGSGESRLLSTPRVRRVLDQWEAGLRQREVPKPIIVLRLDPPVGDATLFSLSFFVETKEAGRTIGPVPIADVWADSPQAHRLADDTGPLTKALRETLHKAGQLVAPIEVSLASDAPTMARLNAEEAWSVLSRHLPALEALGCRLELSAVLQGLDARFPKARVQIARADGRTPAEVSLAGKYGARWEVAAAGQTLSEQELRQAGTAAPLARVNGTWIPVTGEASERLARVVERGEVEWTGPQALSAALAGEVRQSGDLADAAVIAEPGLSALITELAAEVELAPPPPGLQATLRGYQARGLAWLFHRTRLGLGALLADDMGLGKTVQMIALLLALHNRPDSTDEGGTLLVCPASLVGNWEHELRRFAPSLNVVRHHGSARHKDASDLRAKVGRDDVALTTYGLVRRDMDLLSEIEWGTVVCDEAQNIKNPTSAQAKAVRALRARRRVALTGTPVENRLTELWGLMEFLNPGLLGSMDRFRREIALPLERDRDARALRWLKAATSPFMLRRMKTDPNIAPELPEKEIIRVYCSLTEEQARLYKRAVDESLGLVDQLQGIERSGRVLKLLTELKQICNHPAQYLGDHDALGGRSGKFERAAEMLEEIVESGERALVFTQYVEMGTRLCAHLQQRLGAEMPFFHGGLTLEQRETMVRSFQDDPNGPPILVLSLRAGGVGLNLTRASHVMHYDRWWNPAIEDQATDRAYRIGQTKRVQVHHLITLGTLEERIDRMLESKRGLADAVVTGGEAWLTQLSTDELRALVALGSDAAVESMESMELSER